MFAGKVHGKLVYATKHVLERCAKRGISIDQIKKVLAAPHIQYKSKTGGVHLESTIDRKRIVVIVDEDNRKMVLITCWKR